MNQRIFWGDVRLSQKVREKVKKPAKKVLTFPRKFDKIHKLTRAGTQRDGTEP